MPLISLKQAAWLSKIIALVGMTLLLQIGLIPYLSVYGALPNLPLVLIILLSLIFGVAVGLPVALANVLIFYNFLYKPTFLFSWALVPFLAMYINPPFGVGRETNWIIQVALCSFTVEIINIFVASLSGGIEMLIQNTPTLFLVPVLNALVAIPILLLVKKLFKITEFTNLLH